MSGKIRKLYRGKWQGLTSKTVADLMGKSISTARRRLRELKEKNPDFELIDIGKLIYDEHKSRVLNSGNFDEYGHFILWG